MKANTVEHQIFDHKRWKRKIFAKLLRKKSFRKRFFQSDFFFQQMMEYSPIPCQPLASLACCEQLVFENFLSRNGNLSPYEVMAICALIQERKPQNLLEIGTFDGNTTLQMALNAPEKALVHTIDLPPGNVQTMQPVLKSDLQFIYDEKKQRRKFEETKVAHKVRQHFGDSTAYDFAKFTENGPLDLIFIDGGHSYECVKSDTENALRVVADHGCILWHDFTPHFGGVFQFLCELSKKLQLVHIEGTNLVYYSP
ncbi:MAG: hypothetical protein K1000chlam2_00591 [Chlamydiae bacterium]|nr:hypothetical protein [Chlamydiota bacterium]